MQKKKVFIVRSWFGAYMEKKLWEKKKISYTNIASKEATVLWCCSTANVKPFRHYGKYLLNLVQQSNLMTLMKNGWKEKQLFLMIAEFGLGNCIGMSG
jgi:hypothetical protein